MGATTTVHLALDDALSGLAGYDLVVRFSNPIVAEISEVIYPSWAVINNTTRKADGSVRISGIDISRQVEPGTTDIPLATLKIRGISGGLSSIIIESVYMDADGGAVITPTLPTGTITVPGTSGSSSGVSGGGGGGTSSQATQSPTSSTTSPISTSTQIATTVIQSPAPTIDNSRTLPPVTPSQESTQAGSTVTSGSLEKTEAFPWVWIVGGGVIVIAMILGGYIAMKKERKQD